MKLLNPILIWLGCLVLTITLAIAALSYIEIPKLENVKSYYFNTNMTEQSGLELEKFLDNAEVGDTIHLYVASNGGEAFAMKGVLQAMRDTKATIIYHVRAKAFSAAAIMMCYADKVVVAPDAMIMFHLAQSNDGVLTPSNAITPAQKTFVRMQDSLYQPCMKWLKGKRWEKMLKGEDLWLLGKDLIKERNNG